MKIIRLKLVNPTNPQSDTVIAVQVSDIKMSMQASEVDRRHRPEIGTIIHTSHGAFAVREDFNWIAEQMESLALD